MPVMKIFEEWEELTGQRQSIPGRGISLCKGPKIGGSKRQLRNGKKVSAAKGQRTKEECGKTRLETQVLWKDFGRHPKNDGKPLKGIFCRVRWWNVCNWRTNHIGVGVVVKRGQVRPVRSGWGEKTDWVVMMKLEVEGQDLEIEDKEINRIGWLDGGRGKSRYPRRPLNF